MSRHFALGLALPLVALVCAGVPAVDAPAPVAGDIAITNVTVIDVVAGKAKPAQTVVIKGDRIAAVGPAATTRAADGARTIDGTDRFLIPGLWDMHAHIADPAMPGLFLRYGVTGVRHMFSPRKGFPEREKADPSKGDSPAGPRLVATVEMLDGSGGTFPNAIKLDTEVAARAAVQRLKKSGSEFIKVHSFVPRDAYFAAVKEAKKHELSVVGHVPYSITAAEASTAGQLTIEHLDGVAALCAGKLEQRCLNDLREWAAAATKPGAKTDPHTPWRVELAALDDFDAKKGAALFKTFATNNTWHVPTLVEAHYKARLGDPKALDAEVDKALPVSAQLFWRREYDGKGGVKLSVLSRTYTKEDLLDRERLIAGELKLVAAMHKANVRLLAGTDTPGPLVVPGLSLHEELELFVKAGLTPAEALRTATVAPAECLTMTDRSGTVETGKYADLVLLTKDPLADVRNTRTITAVLIGGRVVPRPDPKK
jgi:imidazolonepropionase-like amidohydrolase